MAELQDSAKIVIQGAEGKLVEVKKPDGPRKIRVLALCDSPTSATGFAQVSRNILTGLVKTGKYEVDVIGINYYGDYYDREKFPYNIYPAMPQGYEDMFGRGRLLNAINGHEDKNGLMQPWDIIFTIQDPFIIEGLGLTYPFAEQLKVSSEMWKRSLPPEFWYKWVGYFPVDAEIKENWVARSIALADYPIAYCDWGKSRILKFDRDEFKTGFKIAITEGAEKQNAILKSGNLKNRISVIHHGVDVDVFKPISREEKKKFRKEYFKGVVKDDTFLVVNVSRNQPRKDITRTLAIFKRFKKKVPNSFLYIHCRVQDAGGSVIEMARNFGLEYGKDFGCPEDFNAGIGFPVDIVNKIYNVADLCMTTTLGEGWGFITTEAMATKTPILAPNITSILDIFDSYVPVDKDSGTNGKGPRNYNLNEWLFEKGGIDQVRGIPAKAGSTSSEWICMGIEDNERIRPLTNVTDMVEKMLWVRDNPGKVAEIVDRGYKWVQELKWENIVDEWDKVFTAAYTDLQAEREVAKKIDKAGRNDPCPCGSGEKFKKCHGSTDKLTKFNDWLVTS